MLPFQNKSMNWIPKVLFMVVLLKLEILCGSPFSVNHTAAHKSCVMCRMVEFIPSRKEVCLVSTEQ